MIYQPMSDLEQAKAVRTIEESLPTVANAYTLGLVSFDEALQTVQERNVWFNTLDLQAMRYLQS